MKIDPRELAQVFGELGQFSQVAQVVGEVIKNDEITKPYLDILRTLGGKVAPLIEEVSFWTLELHIKRMRRMMDEFNITAMEAATMLAMAADTSYVKRVVQNMNTAPKKK